MMSLNSQRNFTNLTMRNFFFQRGLPASVGRIA